MTGFAKTILMAQEPKSEILLEIIHTYNLALPRNTKHMAIDGQACFHKWLFANSVKPSRWTTGSVEPVNDINKDVCDARLLPMIVSTYPVD